MPPYQSQMIFIERRCLEEGRESQTEFWQRHSSEMAQLRQTYPGAPEDYLAHLVAVRIWRYYWGDTFPFPPYTSNVPEVTASTPHQSDDVAEAEQAVYSSSRLTDSMSDRDNSSDFDTIRNQKSTQETFSTTTSGFGGATPEIPDSQDDSSTMLTLDEGSVELGHGPGSRGTRESQDDDSQGSPQGSVELGNIPRSRGTQESQDDDSQVSEQGSVELGGRGPTSEISDSEQNSQHVATSNVSSDEDSQSSAEARRSITPRPRHAPRDGRTEVPETDLESEDSSPENIQDDEDSRAANVQVEEASMSNIVGASDGTGTGDFADDEDSDRDTL
ncbi:hypothetical protein BGZ57DRAFT_847646 [Hyaloscypha finlandica]|nr:hypothetical protein BGZ57DRAFT_847646 [Hyaloscypha finlandica]